MTATKPVYVEAQRRSSDRQAALTVRMSREERAALDVAASQRGMASGDLLREAVKPLLANGGNPQP